MDVSINQPTFQGDTAMTNLEFLRQFEFYCMDENAWMRESMETQPQANYERVMRQLQFSRTEMLLATEYGDRQAQAAAMVESLDLVHYTFLDNLINILKVGALWSRDRLSDEYLCQRIASWGLDAQLHGYVICGCGESDWHYGMYKVIFKRDVESIPGARFLPRANGLYNSSDITAHIMELSNWRSYLTEHIAIHHQSPAKYLNRDLHLRPEFFIPDAIPIEYVAEINCATAACCTALKQRIGAERDIAGDTINRIRITYPNMEGS